MIGQRLNPLFEGVNNPFSDHTVHDLFLRLAQEWPSRPAITHGSLTISYGSLAAESAIASQQLSRLGALPGSIIPIVLSRSIDLIVAILGVLRAGCAYSLIDPALPLDPLVVKAARQASAGFYIGQEIEGLEGCQRVAFDNLMNEPLNRKCQFESEQINASTPATLIFTSGTTGTPKGVLVPHRAITRLTVATCGLSWGPEVHTLQAAPLQWDGFTLELWPTLLSGGLVTLSPAQIVTPAELRTQVIRGVNRVWLTSSLLNFIVDSDVGAFSGLSCVMTGGERLSPGHIRTLVDTHPKLEVFNGYGPVESCVFATVQRIDNRILNQVSPGMDIPIGLPIAATQLKIGSPTSEFGEEPTSGELFIGGDGVAIGYIGALPSEDARFVSQAGKIWYRTGDLVHVREGRFFYIGRDDRQVKWHGHRIELDGIERSIAGLDGIGSVAVLFEAQDGVDKHLVAYYQLDHEANISERELRKMLANALPRYALPKKLHCVSKMPLTPQGKVDRKALVTNEFN
ncbi:AMP-binding protein (plasmid) [Glutamicibacter sp. FR1]|uniref:AMP-binding protein n=1 Tax=Glutamicibacter sp. FR1 TaxID=3393744 RepID=UPI0039AF7A0B